MPVATTTRIREPLYGGTFLTAEGGALPYVLPGELVDPSTTAILEPAASRVKPGCPHFGVCGGCHYQHAAYPGQLALKQQILTSLLTEAGLQDLPPLSTQPSPHPWHYRNRIRLRVERLPDAAFAVGYSRRASNDFLAIRECPIAAPLLWRAAQALLTLPPRVLAALSEAEFFTNHDESKLQLQLFLRDAEPFRGERSLFASTCDQLRTHIPELAGAGALLDPELNRRTRRSWDGAAWGAAGLQYEVNGRAYWVARGAFFQVNRFLVGALVDQVCDQSSGALAWDLFAGVGLFTRVLTERCAHVVAVEGAASAAQSLEAASHPAKGRSGFHAVHASTLDFLRREAISRERPELVVADPPRAGLGAESAELLTRIAPRDLVYVSCDPTSLARDLAILTRERFHVEATTLIDLFPQTYHIETVVRLSRR